MELGHRGLGEEEQGLEWPLTAVGGLLIRLVLAVGDTITGEAEADALPIGTLKLILCPAGGVHSWGGRSFHELQPSLRTAW